MFWSVSIDRPSVEDASRLYSIFHFVAAWFVLWKPCAQSWATVFVFTRFFDDAIQEMKICINVLDIT